MKMELKSISETRRRNRQSMPEITVVCVTGGSGCIGSWVVHLLLLRGYTVHATVKDLKDEKETGHLKGLEGASTRLHLFQMELLDYDSVFAPIKGCVGVFHVASPCIIGQVEDPQRELTDPAVKGTMNVLMASKEAGVRRVVLTSSIAAISRNPSVPADKANNENVWSDEEYCEQNGFWYTVAKTRAERAAWKFSEETSPDLVVVNPVMVLGPVIPPTLNASMRGLLGLLQGSEAAHRPFFAGCVHFKDVAEAHILLYENPSAKGRHICAEAISPYRDFLAKITELYPEYEIPKLPNDRPADDLPRNELASKKLIDLGIEFTPMEQIIKDSVESLKKKGFLS